MNLKKAKKLSKQLMDKNGLKDWIFIWNELNIDKIRYNFKMGIFFSILFGECDLKRKLLFFCPYLTEFSTEKEFKNIVLHEIAHAIVGEFNHGKKWKSKFIELGGNGEESSAIDYEKFKKFIETKVDKKILI